MHKEPKFISTLAEQIILINRFPSFLCIPQNCLCFNAPPPRFWWVGESLKQIWSTQSLMQSSRQNERFPLNVQTSICLMSFETREILPSDIFTPISIWPWIQEPLSHFLQNGGIRCVLSKPSLLTRSHCYILILWKYSAVLS